MPAHEVDGHDFFAVYEVAREVIERARAGGGPSLRPRQAQPLFRAFRGRRDDLSRPPTRWPSCARPKDPLQIFRQRVVEAALLEPADLDAIDAGGQVAHRPGHGRRPRRRRCRPRRTCSPTSTSPTEGPAHAQEELPPSDQRGAHARRWSATIASSSWARTSPAAWARPARTTPGAARWASPRA